MNTIKHAYIMGERGIRHLIHHPISMIFTLFSPLVWFLLFGQLFKGVTQLPGFPTDNYLLYVLPGVLGILILSLSLFNANNVVFDKVSGYFAKLLSFPVSRLSIAMGYAIDTLVQMLVLIMLLLAIGLPIAGGIASGWVGLLLIFWLSILFGFAMTCLGLSMALVAPTAWEFFGMINFIELPLLFTSSALFPETFMPGWLRIVSMLNPLSHYVNGVRALVTTELDWNTTCIATLVLLVYNLLFFSLIRVIYLLVVAV